MKEAKSCSRFISFFSVRSIGKPLLAAHLPAVRMAGAVASVPGLKPVDDSVEAVLTNAAVEVVASAGVAATSMTRVARRARVSTGSLYPRFKSAEQLIEHSFSVAIDEIVAKNVDMVIAEGIGADQYALSINAGFG